MVFYVTAIRKALAEPVAVAEAEAEFAADARWTPCNPFVNCEFVSCHR